MSGSTSIRRLLFIVPISLVLGAAILGLAKPASTPDCVVAAEWAFENRSNLPATLSEFSTFRMSYRRAIYRELDSLTQMRLWREHFESFLDGDTQLTPEQALYLETLISNVDRYVGNPIIARKAVSHDSVTVVAKRVFGDSLARAIVATLGPEEQPITRDAPQSLNSDDSDSNTPPVCSCSYSSDWCYVSVSHCILAADDCRPTTGGCGTLFCHDCTGICAYQAQ